MTVPILGPPTAHLPSISKIKSCSIADLVDAIQYLTLLYNPKIHGSRVIDRRSCPLRSGARPHSPCSPRRRLKPLQIQTEATLTAVRADSFERAYAVRWLTALVSRALLLEEDTDEVEAVIEQASRLLAICAGPASAGTRSRTFVFTCPPISDVSSIKVQVTDLPLNNQDYSSVGAQTWGGACLLAEMITQSPQHFGSTTSGIKAPRILELGAGTGLVSLATAKLLSASGTPATIIATDFHSAVLENLEKNIADNFPVSTHVQPITISPHFLDWSNPPDPPTTPFEEPFDVIYGADVVYELDHALWIKTCIERFLRKPSLSSLEVTLPTEASTIAPSTHPRFHLVIPFRATHTTEAESVEKAFRAHSRPPSEQDGTRLQTTHLPRTGTHSP